MDNRTDSPPLIALPESEHRPLSVRAKALVFADPASRAVLRFVEQIGPSVAPALILGAIAAVPSYIGLMVRAKTSLDDSLDVVAAHGLGGTVGAILTGVFAEKALNGAFDGALYGNVGQVGIQVAAVVTAIVYSGAVTFVLLKVISLFMPLRATVQDEGTGLDITQHGEEAYLHSGGMEAVIR